MSHIFAVIVVVLIFTVAVRPVSTQECTTMISACGYGVSCPGKTCQVNCHGINWIQWPCASVLPSTIDILDLSINKISFLPADMFDGIVNFANGTLDLHSNPITFVTSGSFVNVLGLNRLLLNNNILPQLTTNMFSGLALTGSNSALYLDANPISIIASGAFNNVTGLNLLSLFAIPNMFISTGAFTGLTSLSESSFLCGPGCCASFHLSCPISACSAACGSNNTCKVSGFWEPSSDITCSTRITVCDSSLITLCSFVSCPGVDCVVACAGLSLTKWPCAAVLPNLIEFLVLNSNAISMLPEDMFDGPVTFANGTLNLWSNAITLITPGAFSNCIGLSSLHLYNNPIAILKTNMFSGLVLTGLPTHLYLSNATITFIAAGAFNNVTGLTVLDLSGNSNLFLPSNAFIGLSSHIFLLLYDSPNMVISSNAFNGLNDVAFLRLDGNTNMTLSSAAFNGTTLPNSAFICGDLFSAQTCPVSACATACGSNAQCFVANVWTPGVNISCSNPASWQACNLTLIKKCSSSSCPGNNCNINCMNKHWVQWPCASTLPSTIYLLDLSHNLISILPANMFNGTVKFANGTSKLSFVSNFITIIVPRAFINVVGLSSLMISYNFLSQLSPSSILSGLVLAGSFPELEIAGNYITFIAPGLFSMISGVNTLYLSGNQLTVIVAGMFDGLNFHGMETGLDLAYNLITYIATGSLAKITGLTSIDLDYNLLTQLTPNMFNGLNFTGGATNLLLSHNPVTLINSGAFNNVTGLKEIYISNSPNLYIATDAFTGLTSLTLLFLYNNSNITIAANAFEGLVNLGFLRLDGSANMNLSANTFDGLSALANFFCGPFADPQQCSASACASACGVNSSCFVSGIWIPGANISCSATTTSTGTPTATTGSSAIVGAVVGGIFGAIVAAIVVLLVLRRRSKRAVGFELSEGDLGMHSVQGLMSSEMLEYEIERSKLTMDKEIGRGEFGVVMKAIATGLRDYDQPIRVAVKVMRDDGNESLYRDFVREAMRLRDLDHPNIVKLIGVVLKTAPHVIILEYMTFGDLKSVLRQCENPRLLTLSHLTSFALDVSRGFSYLQDRRFVHRDLAARNVLVDAAFVAKIGDFGMSRRLYNSEYYNQQGDNFVRGSLALPVRWMAPESYFDGTWDLRSDVWMFGVLLWEIFSFADLPWEGVNDDEIMRLLQNREKLSQRQDCPTELHSLMLECWKLDVALRPTSLQIQATIEDYSANLLQRDSLLDWPDIRQIDDVTDNNMTPKQSDVVDLNSDEVNSMVKSLEIRQKYVKIGKVLGQGQFGVVHIATLRQSSSSSINVAVKMLRSAAPEQEQAQFQYEAKLLSILQHDNIVKVVGVCLQSQPNMILLEFMTGGDLEAFLRKNADTLSQSVNLLTNACLQLADAMQYLENRRIVHRDLAARNVLVGDNGLNVVKLSDVGLSRTLSTSDYYRKVTKSLVPFKWMSPESIAERLYTTKSDVWSFGVLCWEIYSLGTDPYSDLSVSEVMTWIFSGIRMQQPALCPDDVFELISQCWQAEATDRPSFVDVHSKLYQISDEGTRL